MLTTPQIVILEKVGTQLVLIENTISFVSCAIWI